MTHDELQAIKARAAAATPGPWSVNNTDPDVVLDSDGRFVGRADEDADAEFIAHARTDVPALIAEVERLRELCAKAYDRVRFLDDVGVGGEGWQSKELSDVVAELGDVARNDM